MNPEKNNIAYGIPPKWQVFFTLLLFSCVSLFFVPDSIFKELITHSLATISLAGLVGGFMYNKHSFLPWGFLLIGCTLLGLAMSLIFASEMGLQVNLLLISIVEIIGLVFILLFAIGISVIYEKKLNLSGFVFDIVLLGLAILLFFFFAHPTLINKFLYDSESLQKIYYVKITIVLFILFMSLLLNVLYQGKRMQLLLLVPLTLLLLAQLYLQRAILVVPYEPVDYYSPLYAQVSFVLGIFVGIFSFAETFSDRSIVENHLEIEKTFTHISSGLMRIAITFAVVAIPSAIVIRNILGLASLPIILIVSSILFISLVAVGRFFVIIKATQKQQKKLLSITHTNRRTKLLNYDGLYNHLLRKDIKTLLIVMINIDDFKSANHYYGRKFGDEILISLAKKLERLPNTLACSHIDSDVFIIAYQLEEPEVLDTLNHLSKHLDVWDTVLGKKVAVPLTYGACFNSDAKQLETKIRYAEQALQSAKARHLNQYLFKQTDVEQALPRHKLQKLMQQAIDNNHLPIHFQPIYNLNDGSLKALELLIRIESREHGLLLPKQFLDQALTYGLLSTLTKVCISMVAENIKALPEVTININLPPYIIKSPEVLSELVKHIQDIGLNPKRLCFEITEDENIRAEQLIPQVKFLKSKGFTIAMDDFGTGYSSLERLSLLSFDQIKIDRSLLLAATNGNNTILESSIGLIKRLGESVVVEGVESVEQLSLIRKLGADAVQGFLLSKPLPLLKINTMPHNISDVVSDYS